MVSSGALHPFCYPRFHRIRREVKYLRRFNSFLFPPLFNF